MNSHVIKVVAGGGKTTMSEQILKGKSKGLYLAFTNSVVNCIKEKGYLSKTIDSLFTSFLIPKFISAVPIINNGSKIIPIVDNENLPLKFKGVSQIRIDENGNIFNKGKKLPIDINTPNLKLHNISKMANLDFLKYIFGKNHLRLTNTLRNDLAGYLLHEFPNYIVDFLRSRFSFIVMDEAQDLDQYREKFAALLYESDIETYFLGDINQNIMGGGDWFESLENDINQNKSYRCPDTNCEWIRNNLGIDIYGNPNNSFFQHIDLEQAIEYDDGNRFLLYNSKVKLINPIIESWHGPKSTIKSAKGTTIDSDIVIVGKTLNKKNYYTAITRTRGNVYTTVEKVS